jgi:hypothetical protein
MADFGDFTLEVPRGDTFVFTVVVKLSGVAQNITGWSFWATGKKNISDADASAVFQKTSPSGGIALTTPGSGLITVTLAPGDTSDDDNRRQSIFVDVQGKDGSGNIYSLARGKAILLPEITLATA